MIKGSNEKGELKMAEKRMFSKQVLLDDKFIELSAKSQVLYFQLSMYADDEGFVNCAKYVQRLTATDENDIEALCKNGFLIRFESGVYAITHWKINNHIRGDRLKKTSFTEERDMLYVRADGMYVLNPEKAAKQREKIETSDEESTDSDFLSDACQPTDGTDKGSEEKEREDKYSSAEGREAERRTYSADSSGQNDDAYRNLLVEKFGADNVERYEERFKKWVDRHDRRFMPEYPTIEKWMKEDNVSPNEKQSKAYEYDDFLLERMLN